jgi:leader peptidase (prepilin peptidase) / N-methyltransferase
VLGGLLGVALMAFGRAGRKTAIPFGPFMLLGAWASLLVGGPISEWYLRSLGLG